MNYLLDVTPETFDEVVIQGSATQLVVVDFWAPWCAPCKQLKPMLEQLANEYQYLLAKVNTEEFPDLATQHGVRGIPDVRIYNNGEVIEQFSGAKSETEVREILEKYLLSATDQALLEIKQLAQTGDHHAVVGAFNNLLAQQPDNDKIKISAASYLIDAGDQASGNAILATIKQGSEFYSMAQNQLALEEFHKACANKEQQTGSALLYAQAACAATAGDYPSALEQLLTLFKTNRNFDNGIAQKSLLILFELLGKDDPLTRQYQRKLAMYLY